MGVRQNLEKVIAEGESGYYANESGFVQLGAKQLFLFSLNDEPPPIDCEKPAIICGLGQSSANGRQLIAGGSPIAGNDRQLMVRGSPIAGNGRQLFAGDRQLIAGA
jgi:hypothetical protein